MIWLEAAESTNSELRALVAGSEAELPHGTLVVTANQTAGRGRQGRGWETPPDTALAASLLLRPEALRADGSANSEARGRGVGIGAGTAGGVEDQPALGLSWLPLLAGSAVAAALQPLFRGTQIDAGGDGFGDRGGYGSGDGYGDSDGYGDGDGQGAKRVGVKWPNDVHVRDEDDAMAGRPGAKLCGILCEVLGTGEVVVGFGINLLQEDWQLPTERAGSVLACGGATGGAESLGDPAGQALADRVLSAAVRELLSLVELADSKPKSARTRVLRDSVTLGSEVRVHLPGGEMVDGRAISLADDGALIVDRPTTGQLIVNAADVEHLR